jgi:predicted Mrr-cat superfamily restriction endonuclease
MSDPIALRNRFAMVKGAWDEHLRGTPFPSLGDGTAEQKIERLELALIDEMRSRATPETAEQVADAMWSLVHARPEGDLVKLRVEAHHEDLARLGHRRI